MNVGVVFFQPLKNLALWIDDMGSGDLSQIQFGSDLPGTFWRRVLRAGGWSVLAQGGNQILRFAGTLMLTRLLFPEAFGLMALVQIVLFGVNMFSDIGIGPAIVQSAHGRDRNFLNTAWSLQVLRGLLIWVIVCVLAYPVAIFYGQLQLIYLIPVVGFVSVIDGFIPTMIHVANRELNIKFISLVELSSYFVGLVLMVILAWLTGSVWSLVAGGLLTSVCRYFLIYRLPGGRVDKFAIDRESFNRIVGFGGWILIGSILTFVAIEGGRIFIGAVLDIKYLAFYTIAYSLCMMYTQMAGQVFGRVFFPAIAEINRSNPAAMAGVVFRLRAVVVIPGVCLAYIFALYGAELVALFYDARYAEAGRILEIISLGIVASSLSASFGGLLLAVGRARAATVNTAIQVVTQISCLAVGYMYSGVDGVLYGLVISSWLVYLLQSIVIRLNGFSLLRFDLFAVLISAPVLVVYGVR